MATRDGGTVSGSGSPLGIACDSANIYSTDILDGTVTEAQLSGLVEVSIDNQVSPAGIAVDANNIYWTTLGSTPDGGGTVMATAIDGGGPLVTLATGQQTPYGIAVANGNVYWQNLGTSVNGYKDGTVMMAPASGQSPPRVLASAQVASALEPTGPADILAVDSNNLYWIANRDVMRMQLASGRTSQFGLGAPPAGIAIDSNNLYYTLGADIMSVPLDGGSPVTLATGQQSPGAIAVSSAGVFWSSHAANGSCPIQGLPLP